MHAEKPQSSAKTANGKSVYWSGRKRNWFCVPLHEALAEEAAVADRDARVVSVPARAEDVRVGVRRTR